MAKKNGVFVKFDFSEFEKVLDDLSRQVDRFSDKAIQEMGDELLRVSAFEVPHDIGILSQTGRSELVRKGVVEVGYHTPYAARLHEHPEYKFKKGRKGKFLEDPLKRNLIRWLQVYADSLRPMF
jgi:hypothetical protein